MTIVNDATRQELMEKVPNIVEDWTCIGCGLQKAIEVIFYNVYYKYKII